MKRLSLFITIIFLSSLIVKAVPVHENMRTVPYPQDYHTIYVNPCPLLVPEEMKKSDFIQFSLSRDKGFNDSSTIMSKPLRWHMYNPHKKLERGRWYWRFRGVNQDGSVMSWSKTYSFDINDNIPVFVTPEYDLFKKNLPKGKNRIYCFLQDGLDTARKKMRNNPDFEMMITESREALGMDFSTDTQPYRKENTIYKYTDYLHTAYTMLQLEKYADKMVANVRCLLNSNVDNRVIASDFAAGELAYIFSCTYDACYDKFTQTERDSIAGIVGIIFEKYMPHIIGHKENHIFDNHFWQFTLRRFLQASLVFHEINPLAAEYLEYCYELWTARAPASGFNRDGNWHNGTSYFSANAVSLFYVPALFSYVTKTDFFAHPWYKNAGIGLAYSWLPGSMSVGFGDGHENMNPTPLRIRSAFADLLARVRGDQYASWYSSLNKRYLTEYETRLYRLAMNLERPSDSLPSDAPKALWLKDSGEMIANSDINNLDKNLCLSFRSSPFGSGSHTHSNQNAFNLHYKGVPVYRAIGHYMNFADPHNLLSYRNTRAYNTILVNGIGQPFSIKAYGNIVRMFNGDNISYALGDASEAYYGISEYPMWQSNFKSNNLEQSPENGFGKTPLKKYRRHIFLLHPDKVVIYDELEADSAVRWDWLLHSYVKFDIEGNKLITYNKEHDFTSVAHMFCEQKAAIDQTDKYIAPPNINLSVRGEDFSNKWTLTSSFGPSKKIFILTLIKVVDGKATVVDLNRKDDGCIFFDDWMVNAELNVKRKPSLVIKNKSSNVIFSYGKNSIDIDSGKKHKVDSEASVLYDTFMGNAKLCEMKDCLPQKTGLK